MGWVVRLLGWLARMVDVEYIIGRNRLGTRCCVAWLEYFREGRRRLKRLKRLTRSPVPFGRSKGRRTSAPRVVNMPEVWLI